MPLQPTCLTDRVTDDPKLRMIRIRRSLFPMLPGNRLERRCQALGSNLILRFAMRGDPPDHLARGFLHTPETPLFEIGPCAGETRNDECGEQATEYKKNIQGREPLPQPPLGNLDEFR